MAAEPASASRPRPPRNCPTRSCGGSLPGVKLRPLPPVMYAWIAGRLSERMGRTRLARHLAVDVEDVRRMARGDVVPSQAQRVTLERLFVADAHLPDEDSGREAARPIP